MHRHITRVNLPSKKPDEDIAEDTRRRRFMIKRATVQDEDGEFQDMYGGLQY